jgi:ABC-type Fe3+-hydroxamate transport system substrate-binding protein
MKRLSLLVFLLAIAFVFTTVADSYSQETPTVSSKLNKKSYKPGETGFITIKFKTAKTVKIPVEPEVEVTLNGSNIEGIGVQSANSSGEYLSPAQVKYKFKVSNNATSGSSIDVTGTVKFGYCNADSGICKIATKNISFTVKVK